MTPERRRRDAAASEAISLRVIDRMFHLCESLGWSPDPDWAAKKPLAFRPFGPDKPPMLAAALVLSDPEGKAAPIAFVLVALTGGVVSAEFVEHHDLEIQKICSRYCVSLSVGHLVPPRAGGESVAKVNLSMVVLEHALTTESILEATKLIHMAQMELADLCREPGLS
jgi:hypothetical protein